jgi:hypothetical protein
MANRSRAWTFTLNNWSEEELIRVKENLSECRYWIMGKEIAPETLTPHIQGYLYCKNAVSFNTVRLWLLGRAHVEKARGNVAQNYEYCSKDKDFEEYGDRPMTAEEKGEVGKESQQVKWAFIWEKAKAGKIAEVAEKYPKEAFVYARNLTLIRQIGVDGCADLNDVCGLWLYGESGAGKSHRSRHIDVPEETYIKGINKWWCNYYGQRTVVLEDVGKDHAFLGDFLKIWADKWAFTAEFKGGSMARMRPQRLVVTSQYRIDDIWMDKETRDALHRRFVEEEVKKGPLDVLLRALPTAEPAVAASFPGVGAQELSLSPLPTCDVSSPEDESEYERNSRKRKRCEASFFIEDECEETD